MYLEKIRELTHSLNEKDRQKFLSKSSNSNIDTNTKPNLKIDHSNTVIDKPK